MTDQHAPEPVKSESRKAVLLLLAAIVLMLIPVVIGWRMANTESSDDAGSGMEEVSSGDVEAGDIATGGAIGPAGEDAPRTTPPVWAGGYQALSGYE